MASNRQRRLITKLYIASALLILIGIGVLIGGILGGLSLRNKLERLGRELAVLEHDNIDDWGDIPGRRERELNHQFHVFNITNPREVFYGQQPISQMHGPWTFNEERDTETVEVSRATDVFNETGELFSYDEAVKFYHTRSPQDMSDEMSETFSVYNPDTFTMQYSHRVEDDWLRAIRSLSGMINYTSTQFRDTLILQYMRKHYFPDHYSSKQVFTDTRLVAFVNHPRVPRATIDSLWSDEIFGFSNFENAKFWGDICEQRLRFGKTFIKDYFFLPTDGLASFMELFCRDWNSAAHAVEAAFRMRGIISPEIMFYRQWSNRGATDRIYKRPLSISDVDPLVPGYVDLPGFLEGVFFTNMGIRGQFEDVNFAGSVSLETRLLKLFTQEDLRVSLFNATNMKTLFELSALVNVDNFTGQYEVFRLQPLVDEMNGQVSTKELFVVYSFLRNLIENTFLQSNTPHNSTFDKTMMAFTLTDVIRNEFTRFRANFTSRMIAAGAIRFLQLDDCRTSFVRLFPRERASTFCNIPKFDITTMEGARFWWRLYIGRRPQDIALLESETPATLADFEKYFDDDYSDFTLFTQSMLDGIGMRLLNTICRKEGDLWCSIQEISFHQMMSGIITLNPPPILRGMTAADNFVTFFGLEDTQLISPEFNFLGKFQDFELDPEVDVTYRHVIQGMRDSRLFNPFFILKILNDQCSEVERFCTENFRIWLTFLYRNRGLPPLIRRLTVKEILNGTYSPHLLDIQRKNPQYGGDPTIRTDFNVLPHNGVPETTLRMNVFSGDVNPDRARNLLKFDSEKEYITAERTFYHVDRNPLRTGVQEFEVNPWTQEVWFAGGTDGFQFNPDMTRRDDLIFYADYFKAMIKVDFQSVINAFGLKAFIFETPISIYQRITEGEIGGITLDGQNPYHNFHFYDMFNASAVFRSSYFVTEPMFSRLGGANVRELSSEIIDRNGDSITGQAHWNDRILCEPWSGLIIRGDTGFQMNFFYDSYTPEEYHQYLMPYVLYNKRLDIDGALARDLFHDITIIDERMRLVFILSMIIGGILASSGGSLLALTIFRNRQRSKILKEIREEESERKRLKMQNRMNGNQSRDTGADTRINGSLLQE